MCGRFVIQPDEYYQDLMNLVEEIEKQQKTKTGEIYPTNTVPVIINNGSGREVHLYKWGFPSFKSNSSIINARAETIEEKPMFRKAFHNTRCLIPSHGFYEWQQDTDIKQKYHIGLKEQPIMFMGGLYNTFKNKDGALYDAFTIITAAANDTMSAIHQRMPVIIDPEYHDVWLQTNADMDIIRGLLKPYSKDMILKPVG